MVQIYSPREHNMRLEQHDRRYREMERVRDTVGRDNEQYRQAHEDVVLSAHLMRVAARRPKRHP